MTTAMFGKALRATIRFYAAVLLATFLSAELNAAEPQAIVIGIDLTVEDFAPAQIRRSLMSYLHRRCDDGASIIAVAITGKTFIRPLILAEALLPAYPGIKGRARRMALEKFESDLIFALENKTKLGRDFLRQSRIADFFKLAANLFVERSISPKRRSMILFSDMLEVDERRNWERDGELRANDLRIHTMGGTVAIYGVQSRFYPDVRRWDDVRKIWIELLKQARITVQAYSNVYYR